MEGDQSGQFSELEEQRIHALINAAPFPIAVYIGKEMKIQYANQSIIDVWGKGKDIVGRTYYEILPELEGQQIYPQLDGVFTSGVPFHATNRQVELVINGVLQPFYFNYSFTPLFDRNGKVYGVMNTAADVTDLNVAVKRLEQSERNIRHMVLQAPVAMCILLGPNHVVEIANDYIIELWGKPRETVMNRPIFEGLPDAREQGLEQLLAYVYKSGVGVRADERPVVLFRNGKYETVYQNFVYEPYRDSDGTILGVLAITIDVTDQVTARMKIEEVVDERTRDLKKSNDELSQFAYVTSHDLQEPARKISTFVEMLQNSLGDRLDPKSKGYLDKIDLAAGRMLRLIRDILSFSQLSSAVIRFEKVDINKILNEIKSDFELTIEQKHCELIIDPLPTIDAVPVQMSLLFGNLVSNALKFTRTDAKPVITITCTNVSVNESPELASLNAQRNHYVKIVVTDNGIGFAQENAPQIFNIFQRLHSKTEFAGTGIGLAMCKKIAENHGGVISAKSQPGSGSAFTVVLPAQQ